MLKIQALPTHIINLRLLHSKRELLMICITSPWLCSLDFSGSLLSSTLNNLSLLWLLDALTISILQLHKMEMLMLEWELNSLGLTMLDLLLWVHSLLHLLNSSELSLPSLLNKQQKPQETTQLLNASVALLTAAWNASRKSSTTSTRLPMLTWLSPVKASANPPGMDSCLT